MSNSFEMNKYHVTDGNKLSQSNTQGGLLRKVKLVCSIERDGKGSCPISRPSRCRMTFLDSG